MEFDRVRRIVGFRFLPTDEELVVDYLLSKLIGFPLPSDDYVKDCNLYGDLEPWDIWKQYFRGGAHEEEEEEEEEDEKKNDLYFFTPLKKRTATGQRIDRSVGSNGGAWHGEDTGKESQTLDGAVSWTQKRFTYRAKKSKGGQTSSCCCSWIMHEYCLLPIPALGLDSAAASKLALCRIRKKENSKKRKNNNNNNKSAPRVILIHDAAYTADNVAPAASDQGSTTTYKRRKLHGGDQQVVASSSVDVEMERPCLSSEVVVQGSASGGGHEEELVSPPFQAVTEGCSSAVLKEGWGSGGGHVEGAELESWFQKVVDQCSSGVKQDHGVDGKGNEEEEEEDSLFDKEIEESLAQVKEDNGIDGNGNQGVVSPSFQAGSNEGEGAMTQLQQSMEMESVTAEEAAWWSAVSASASGEGTCNVNDAFGFNVVDCGYTVEGLLAECCC
ncbi:unnamed protein product [Linum tenue]|uniref:NAC domain-containing protein n=1 Tax=Linum tenue TaxID=586396 RepID=A0AAV0JLB5_9ROSI|nr:unnamed protein product [Linum tenue]